MADPLWINAPGGSPAYAANELRQNMALPLMYGGRNLGARMGVRPGGTQLQVSLAGSVITVQPGACCIDPGLTTPQGPYWVALPAAENPGPLAAADGSYARKDIVIGRVYDHDEDSSGLRLARSEYLAGVAGPAPNEPGVPPGAFRLATIDVPKVGAGAPVVTNNAPYTVAAGGLLPVRNQAERDAITPYAYGGLPIWRLDRGWIEVNVGGAAWWVQGSAQVTSIGDLAAITHPYKGLRAFDVNGLIEYVYNGTRWTRLPGVYLRRGRRTEDKVGVAGEVGVMRIDGISLTAQQGYLFQTSTMRIDGIAGETAKARLRIDTTGAPADEASTEIGSFEGTIGGAFVPVTSGPIIADYYPASDQTVSVILTLARTGGSSLVNIRASATRPLMLACMSTGDDIGNAAWIL